MADHNSTDFFEEDDSEHWMVFFGGRKFLFGVLCLALAFLAAMLAPGGLSGTLCTLLGMAFTTYVVGNVTSKIGMKQPQSPAANYTVSLGETPVPELKEATSEELSEATERALDAIGEHNQEVIQRLNALSESQAMTQKGIAYIVDYINGKLPSQQTPQP